MEAMDARAPARPGAGSKGRKGRTGDRDCDRPSVRDDATRCVAERKQWLVIRMIRRNPRGLGERVTGTIDAIASAIICPQKEEQSGRRAEDEARMPTSAWLNLHHSHHITIEAKIHSARAHVLPEASYPPRGRAESALSASASDRIARHRSRSPGRDRNRDSGTCDHPTQPESRRRRARAPHAHRG